MAWFRSFALRLSLALGVLLSVSAFGCTALRPAESDAGGPDDAGGGDAGDARDAGLDGGSDAGDAASEDAGPDAAPSGDGDADAGVDGGVDGGDGPEDDGGEADASDGCAADPCGTCDSGPSNDCAVPVDEGLVAQWRFDRGAGAQLPATGSCETCDGVLVGFTSLSAIDASPLSGWVSDPTFPDGGVLRFDGTDDGIYVPGGSALLQGWPAFTVEMFIRPADIATDRTIYSAFNIGKAFYLEVETGGKLSANFYEGTDECSTSDCLEVINEMPRVIGGVWQQVTVTFANGSAELWVDAIEDTTIQASRGTVSAISQADVPHRIGVRSDENDDPQWDEFMGDIAVVRIYDRALDADELLQNRTAELAAKRGSAPRHARRDSLSLISRAAYAR